MSGIIPLLTAQHAVQRRWTITTIVLGIIAATTLLAGIFNLPQRQQEASRLVTHTLEVLGAASTLEAHFQQTVSEGRAFIISGRPDTGARADAAAARTNADLTTLRVLTTDNIKQRAALDRLSTLIDERFAMLREIIGFAKAGDQAGLQQHLKFWTSKPLTEQILADMDGIRSEETRLLALHQSAADSASRNTVVALVACGIVATISFLSGLMLLLIRRHERRYLSELRRSNALLHAIQETTPGLLYAKDLQGRMLLANPPSLALIGKPWAEVKGRTDREFLDDPAQGEAIMANDRRVMDEGGTEVVEERVGRGGDNSRIFLATKAALRDADGTIVGMVGMSVDITDRKDAEDRLHSFNAKLEASVSARTAQLAASEARQRAYFHNSPIGMVVMEVRDDGQFVLEDMNPAARGAFGFSLERARGLTQSELWPELVARDKQQKMRSCASSRQIIEYSVARSIHGKTRQLEIALAPLMDGSAEVRFVLICVRDVTKQRKLERQIVEQAERQAEAAELERALFQNSPEPVFIVRVEGEATGMRFAYEAISPSVERFFRLRIKDLIGHDPESCLPPWEGELVAKRYRRCVEERTTINYVETRQLAFGKRDFEGSITPILHPSTGRVVRLVGAIRDVTERNRLEAELRHSHKMQAIGRLAAGVAHDFNNILQAVIGSLEIVMEKVDVGTLAHEFAGLALGSAIRGSHLTHHLLSYAHKQMLRPQHIDLATFLPDIKKLLARTLGPQVAINLNVKQKPVVLADPGELQTALLNLAINAAQAMPKSGTLQIDVLEEITPTEPCVSITVTDSGVGMDETTLAQATEPFFTTKGVGGGAGLGLSMVQGFVEQSGGTFRIASTLGLGTTVELRLPTADRAHQYPTPEPASQPVRIGRILLVDDMPDVLVTVGAFLREAGFTVVRADCGEQAVTFLEQGERFDALVTDYAMPHLNGDDLVGRARLIQPGLAALIITGYASFSEADTAAEGVTVLHKPFRRQALIETLLRAIGEGPTEKTSPRHATLARSLN